MLRLKENYYKDIEIELQQYLYDTFYVPLLALINDPVYYNSINDVINALNNGQITYIDNEFKGKFNIKISKTLSKFAEFDKRNKVWKVKNSSLIPSDIKSTIAIVKSNSERLNTDMNTLFDNLEDRFNNTKPELYLSIGKTVDEMQERLQQDLSSLGIQLTLTPKQRQNIIKDYNQNQELNIKNWDFDQVERLRDMVLKVNEEGFSKINLVSLLETEWDISKNKAKFLARQETSLFLSKFRKEQNLRVGVTKYKWSTSQDERVRNKHEELHGKVFFYGDPPIVDTKTGRKAEPGEDFNCRCVAISVL